MSEKTEQPTAKKLLEARRRGEAPKSREATTALLFLTAGGVLGATGAELWRAFEDIARACLVGAAAGSSRDAVTLLRSALEAGFVASAPAVGALVVVAAMASFVQVGPMWSADAVSPKLERLDVFKSARNLFSQRQLIELAKSCLKLLLVGWVSYYTLRDAARGVVSLASRDAAAILSVGGEIGRALVLRAGAAMALVAIADLIYQRWRFMRDQRMSKDEVKREHRESEGDPHQKQARDRMRHEILEHNVLEEVRRADVLVVNPTHFAIALRYDDGDEDAVPEVLAKGRDELARRMIAAAEEAGVPVMRDVPLAHALYEMEVGDGIPEALYEAVAVVLRAAYEASARGEGRGDAGEGAGPEGGES